MAVPFYKVSWEKLTSWPIQNSLGATLVDIYLMNNNMYIMYSIKYIMYSIYNLCIVSLLIYSI